MCMKLFLLKELLVWLLKNVLTITPKGNRFVQKLFRTLVLVRLLVYGSSDSMGMMGTWICLNDILLVSNSLATLWIDNFHQNMGDVWNIAFVVCFQLLRTLSMHKSMAFEMLSALEKATGAPLVHKSMAFEICIVLLKAAATMCSMWTLPITLWIRTVGSCDARARKLPSCV